MRLKTAIGKTAFAIGLAALFSGCTALRVYQDSAERFNTTHDPNQAPGHIPVWQQPPVKRF